MKRLFLTAILCMWAYGALAADTIKIGLLAPLSGSYATEGQQAKQVVELLAEELALHGGIAGKEFTLITEDDASDPRTAALAAQRLVAQGVVAVIGTYGSSITEATQGIFNEAGIVQVAYGATAIRLTTKRYRTFFRTCPRDDQQAKAAVQAITNLGYRRVAILHDNSTYAKGLADQVGELLRNAPGTQVVFFDAIAPGGRDFSSTLMKLRGANPSIVFFTGYYNVTGLLLRQKKEMGWNVPFMGSDASDNTDLIKIAGVPAAAGFYFLSVPQPKDLPGAEPFLNFFQEKYGSRLNSIYAMLADDAFGVIVAALNGTNGGNSSQISNYIHNNLSHTGLTGRISFDAKGDLAEDSYSVYRVDGDGNFVLQH